MENEKIYMNIETGSVDTQAGWIYEEDGEKVDPVESGAVIEVELINGVWEEKN